MEGDIALDEDMEEGTEEGIGDAADPFAPLVMESWVGIGEEANSLS